MFGTPEYQAVAKLDRDGEVAVKVTAFCSYGGRTTAQSVDVKLDAKDADAIKSALSKAIEGATVAVTVKSGETDKDGNLKLDKHGHPLKKVEHIPLGQQVFSDAATALVAATNQGEKV